MKVYNSLSRQIEPLTLNPDGKLGVYLCGVTVYARSHLGHAMSAVTFDVIVRYLRERFGDEKIKYVVNFTDIDDKTLEAARAEGRSWREVSEEHIATYFSDMQRLNVAPADVYPKASEHVPKMIEIIETLFEKDLAYEVEGDGVYYKCRNFEGYGKLNGRSLDQLGEDSRVERDDRFDHPADFCLWKLWDHEDAWESPWGKGRPGWHIECSAMSEEHLGLPLDLHGGGMDLKFPHHENEIAQSEGAGAELFSRYWVHHGLLQLDGQKVSKSVGNVLDIDAALERAGPGGVRYYFLGHSYRKPMKYDARFLDEAAKAYSRVLEARRRLTLVLRRPVQPVGMKAWVHEIQDMVHEARTAFSKSMEEDFNTAQALAAIHELVKGINRSLDRLEEDRPDPALREALEAAGNVLDRLMKILGFLDEDGEYLALPEVAGTSAEVDALLTLLIQLRKEARERKDFDTADQIRARLDELGFELRDGPKGTRWERK